MDFAKVPTYEVCLVLVRSQRNVRALLQRLLKPYGLSMNEWLLLALIQEAPPGTLDMNELAEQLDVGKPHVTALFSDLLAVNYVEQSTDPKDKRRKIVKITEHGTEVLKDVETVAKTGLDNWLGEVPQEEFDQFLKVSTQLANKAETSQV
jgi:DNA-binding MarR family transcriptional regulator